MSSTSPSLKPTKSDYGAGTLCPEPGAARPLPATVGSAPAVLAGGYDDSRTGNIRAGASDNHSTEPLLSSAPQDQSSSIQTNIVSSPLNPQAQQKDSRAAPVSPSSQLSHENPPQADRPNRRAATFSPVRERVRAASLSLVDADLRPGVFAVFGEEFAVGSISGSRRESTFTGMSGSTTAGTGRERDRASVDKTATDRGRDSDGVDVESTTSIRPTEGANWKTKTRHVAVLCWNFVKTPVGFFVTIYSLAVICWGAFLFFLLIDALPDYSRPPEGPNGRNSKRQIWIEISSQVMNGLFCVTGFGLAPWRFRDLFYLLRYRLGKNMPALGRLAKIHKGWFIPAPDVFTPGTAEEAEAEQKRDLIGSTKMWKMDFVVWMYVWNTFLQAGMAGLMWGMNRFNRPGGAVGAIVALACIVAAAAGIMVWFEGRKYKKAEKRKLSKGEDSLETGEKGQADGGDTAAEEPGKSTPDKVQVV